MNQKPFAEYATVTPWIISPDTNSEIAFLTTVFGATERPGRMNNPDGSVAHAEVQVGGSVIMLFDSQPGMPQLPSHLRIFVDDLAATLDTAEKNGARVVTRATEMMWGDTVSRIRDPQGHLWWVFEKGNPLDQAEMERRAGDSEYVAGMQYVQDSLLAELSGNTTP